MTIIAYVVFVLIFAFFRRDENNRKHPEFLQAFFLGCEKSGCLQFYSLLFVFADKTRNDIVIPLHLGTKRENGKCSAGAGVLKLLFRFF